MVQQGSVKRRHRSVRNGDVMFGNPGTVTSQPAMKHCSLHPSWQNSTLEPPPHIPTSNITTFRHKQRNTKSAAWGRTNTQTDMGPNHFPPFSINLCGIQSVQPLSFLLQNKDLAILCGCMCGVCVRAGIAMHCSLEPKGGPWKERMGVRGSAARFL